MTSLPHNPPIPLPVVFAKKRRGGITLVVIGVVFGIAAPVVALRPFPDDMLLLKYVICSALAAAAVGMTAAGVRILLSARFAYAFDGRNMAILSWNGTETVDYSQIESVAYRQCGIDKHRLKNSTEQILTIRLRDGRRVVLRVDLIGFEPSFDLVRAHLSEVLARRMIASIAEGQDTPWADDAVLTLHGIRHKMGFTAYNEIIRGEFEFGMFRLYARGEGNTVLQPLAMDIAAENFLPGLHALRERVPGFVTTVSEPRF